MIPPVASVQVTLPVAIVPPANVVSVDSDGVVAVGLELAELDEHPASTARLSGIQMNTGRSRRLRVDVGVMASQYARSLGTFPMPAQLGDASRWLPP